MFRQSRWPARRSRRWRPGRCRQGERDIVHLQKHLVLADEGVLRLGEDALVILARQGLQVHTHGKTALQFGNQIRHFGDVERARGDEEHVIGAHGAVLGVDGRAFDDGEDVPLHALARHVRAAGARAAPGHFVDLVEKDDAVLFGALDGLGINAVHVDEVLFLLGDEYAPRLAHLPPCGSSCAWEGWSRACRSCSCRCRESRRAGGFLDLHLDHHVFHLAASQLFQHVRAAGGKLFLLLGESSGSLGLLPRRMSRGWSFLDGLDDEVGQPLLGVLCAR